MTASAPWQIGEWDLLTDLTKIEQQWAAIREILDDPVRFERADPSVSGWSGGQHAGHMIMVAQTIADRVEGNLAEPDRHRDETPPEVALRVLSGGGFPRGSAVAPDDVHPESRSREEFLAMLPPAVEAWRRIRTRADELPGCPARVPHFRLGYLSSGEWVRLCAIHTGHHLKIVRDITGEAAAPR
jgi:hypothetical protein